MLFGEGCSRDKGFMHPPSSRTEVCKCLGIYMSVNCMNWNVCGCVQLCGCAPVWVAHGISCFSTWGVCIGMYTGNKVSQVAIHSQLHNLGCARGRNCVSVSPRTPSMLCQVEYIEHQNCLYGAVGLAGDLLLMGSGQFNRGKSCLVLGTYLTTWG